MDGILRGVIEGTEQKLESKARLVTLPLSNTLVQCEDGTQFYLLRHVDDAKPKRVSKRRKVGSLAESVCQMKDTRTMEQHNLMAERAQNVMKMTTYKTTEQKEHLPSSITIVLNRDSIVQNPKARGSAISRDPFWTVMLPEDVDKKELVGHLKELTALLQKEDSASKKKRKLVHDSADYMDSIYGDGTAKKFEKKGNVEKE